MFKHARTLLCALFVIALLDPILARKGFGGRHSYPSSRGGLSGGGHHSYPSSGGLSGTGHRPQSHGYPSGGGLSGGGGSHGYPGSHGLSGSGSKPAYPASPGLSGSGSRPGSSGYPNSGQPNHYPSPSHTSHTTIQHHYHYSPPQQIRYVSPSGSHASYPVYRGTPPTYVYQYKNSGSKYGTLLTGLALLNLGVLGGAVYANSQSHKTYQAKPGEICKFGVRRENGDYEETKIDCQIISSFILQAESTSPSPNPQANNVTVVTTTVTNTTTVNMNPVVAPMGGEVMLPNGTLVMNNNMTDNATNTTSSSSSTSTVITTTNTTLVSALDVKGKPIEVTPKMKCYVIKTSPTSNLRKTVDCGLLQAYSEQSLKKNSAVRNIPTFTILTAMLAAFVVC